MKRAPIDTWKNLGLATARGSAFTGPSLLFNAPIQKVSGAASRMGRKLGRCFICRQATPTKKGPRTRVYRLL